tara:strand:- start:14672 stop:14857 length:186 start_codon:yes stop_codon:yes gene_type:complete
MKEKIMFRKRRNKYCEEILLAKPVPKNKNDVILYGDAAIFPVDIVKRKEEKSAMILWGGRR